MALSIRPDPSYTRLMNETKTITLELTPYEQECLLNALSTEAGKWHEIKSQIILGERKNASYEGADMLYKEAQNLGQRVKVLVSQLS